MNTFFEPGRSNSTMLYLRRTLVQYNFMQQLIQHPVHKQQTVRNYIHQLKKHILMNKKST